MLSYFNTRGTFVFLFFCLVGCQSKETADILILNGTIYDGTGAPPYQADVTLEGERIRQIGDLNGYPAKLVIDAAGLAVAPGFIDLHAHLDPILELPGCESHIRQGVTTALGGPDGGGPWPFDSYLDTLQKTGIGMNVGYLVGHNVVRRNIMGLDNRQPTDEELIQMKEQVRAAMEQGAFGISTGLKYLPGTFSNVDEVIALSKVAAEHGGIYTSHLRDEGLGLLDAVKEAIQISQDAGIPVILTHHKVIGKPMWGRSTETLALVDSAREKGLDIQMDQYPYDASYTGISILIPGWARAGGQEAFTARINDPALRDSIKSGIVFNIMNDRGGDDLDRVQFAKVTWQPSLEGKTLKYWCETKGLEPTVDNGAELVIEAQLNGGASAIFHAMDERDVIRIMQHPQTMIASDGRLVAPGMGHPHPRWYGTFPRVLGHFVREKKVLTLEEAIRKMTGSPAKALELMDRGMIKEGFMADLVIFNPDKIIDKATFTDPHQYPEGIEYVLINGQLAVDQGKYEDIRSGEVLKKGV